jgi:hypothetical protein
MKALNKMDERQIQQLFIPVYNKYYAQDSNDGKDSIYFHVSSPVS